MNTDHFNMTTNSTPELFYYNNSLLHELNDSRMEFNIPVIIYLFIVMIFGFLGNVLVIMIYSFFSPRTSANHYILVLAIVDLISCCFCLPFQINDMWNPYVNAMQTLCKIERVVEQCSNITSGLLLVVVASERYTKICYPLEIYELRKAKSLSLLVLTIAFIFSWPQLVINKKQIIEIGKDKVVGEDCTYDGYFQSSIYVFILHGLLYTLYFVAFGSLVFFYCKILAVIILRKRRITAKHGKEPNNIVIPICSGGIRMRSSKTTMCLTTVVVTGILSYIPYLTIMTLRSLGALPTTTTPEGEYYHYGSSKYVDLACTLFIKSYFLSNAVNPIIYSTMNPAFRLRTRKAFSILYSKINKQNKQEKSKINIILSDTADN